MSKEKLLYSIYIKNLKVELIDDSILSSIKEDSQTLITPYLGLAENFLDYVETLIETNQFTKLIIHTNDLKKLWKEFKSLFDKVDAGGGLIVNPSDQILLIVRKGLWDVPKGKSLVGEDPQLCALRECEEEVGLKSLEIVSKIGKTYHVFQVQGETPGLKKTKWYLMKYNLEEAPKIRVQEEISQYQWCTWQEAIVKRPCHPVFRKVIKDYVRKILLIPDEELQSIIQ